MRSVLAQNTGLATGTGVGHAVQKQAYAMKLGVFPDDMAQQVPIVQYLQQQAPFLERLLQEKVPGRGWWDSWDALYEKLSDE